MQIDSEIQSIIEQADSGCPKSQFVLWDYYQKGKCVPISKIKSIHYGKMLGEQPEEHLSFIQGYYGYGLGHFFAELGIDALALGELDDAEFFTDRAMVYILEHYPRNIASKVINKYRIPSMQALIFQTRNKKHTLH